jgi:regulator of protease activity HflC (stomatin/prohibitin superfamily)
MPSLLVAIVVVIFLMIMISRVARVVPQQNAWVVERLGKYSTTLNAGFHILVPFLDTIRYKHSLKEVALNVPEQVCITRDNVQVAVDGVLYFKVLDPARASYGISDYTYAISQLAQTNLRSEIGKIELDRTFEERTNINMMVVTEVDKASEAWGVKVLRYEIKNINPPQDVLAAMEKQMRAEREKRATVLQSEGQRDAAINAADGDKQQVIKASEAIQSVAIATANGIKQIADAIKTPGGYEAMQLRLAEEYIKQFGQLAKSGNSMIIPANLSDVSSVIAMATSVFKQTQSATDAKIPVRSSPQA